MERACLLCRRADTAPELCGLMLEAEGICAHQYCLFFANELFHRRPRNDGLMGFLPEDILHIVERAEQKDCFVCSESGATITCQERGCNRSFHFPCALEGGCVTQFLPHYRSYCWEHRPQQEPQAAPENTACLICLEPVEERTSYGTMVCPACQHAWFHRGCIQGQAMGAGIYCFQCPLCRDKDQFVPVMLILGIRVPLRSVSFCLAHRTGGCKLCHGGTAPAVLALRCPKSLAFSLIEELETGQWGKKSRDVLQLPYATAAGAHPFSFLHQDAAVGERQCIRTPR